MEPLDFTGVDLQQTVPTGRFFAVIDEAEMGEVAGEGKLPKGTPRLTVKWVIRAAVDGDTTHEDRQAYQGFNMPDPSYEKYKEAIGFLGRFLVAVGYEEKDVTGGKFKIDTDDLVGREAIITVAETKNQYGDPVPNVKGVRSIEDAGVGDTSGIL